MAGNVGAALRIRENPEVQIVVDLRWRCPAGPTQYFCREGGRGVRSAALSCDLPENLSEPVSIFLVPCVLQIADQTVQRAIVTDVKHPGIKVMIVRTVDGSPGRPAAGVGAWDGFRHGRSYGLWFDYWRPNCLPALQFLKEIMAGLHQVGAGLVIQIKTVIQEIFNAV